MVEHAKVVGGEVVRIVPNEDHFPDGIVPSGWLPIEDEQLSGSVDETHRISQLPVLVVEENRILRRYELELIPEKELRPSNVQAKAMDALVAIRIELASWPGDLASGANLNTVGQLVNKLSAQEKRNTQRLEKIIQLVLNRFDVPEV